MPNWSVKIIAETATPRLQAFPGRLEREVEMELDAVGSEMVELARSLAPIRTGALRDSIYARASGFELEFGNTVEYGAYVELGTRRAAARPHIRPTLTAYEQRLLDAILVGCMNAFR